jgi:hypothetical protein
MKPFRVDASAGKRRGLGIALQNPATHERFDGAVIRHQTPQREPKKTWKNHGGEGTFPSNLRSARFLGKLKKPRFIPWMARTDEASLIAAAGRKEDDA